jgi:hypothetical protein
MAAQDSALPKIDEVPVIDLTPFMLDPTSEESKVEIEKVAIALHNFGCLVIKDPRVDETHNDRFVDMLERYFEVSDGKRDARPDLCYQVGVTPEGTEVPRDHCSRYADLKDADKPVSVCPPKADPKWRFFWWEHTPNSKFLFIIFHEVYVCFDDLQEDRPKARRDEVSFNEC